MTLVLFPMFAWSTESVGTALNIVEDFNREANILMESRGLAPISTAARDRTSEALKQIRLTEAPGKDRSEKIYDLVVSYTATVMESVKASRGKREAIEEAARRLEDLRAGMLDGLRVSLVAESSEKKEPRPVPSFDLSPHDEPETADDEKGGILFR